MKGACPASGRVGRTAGLVLGCLVGTGCADEEPAIDGTTTRDSAGVTIVESAEPAWGPSESWSLAATPRRTIGSAAGDPGSQLFQVMGAHRFPDGRIVVANAGTDEIRFYDGEGRLDVAVGRDGEGPGEFGYISSLIVIGDSIFAYDSDIERMTILSASGDVRGVFRLPPIDDRPPARPLGVFADGSVLANSPYDFGPDARQGFQRLVDTWVRLDPRDGSITGRVGEFPGHEFYLGEVNGVFGSQVIPFARRSVSAVAGDVFYFGSQHAFVIDRHGLDGRLLSSFRIARPPHPATPADLDGFIANLVERAPSEEVARRLDDHYRAMPLPDRMPAHGRLLVDAVGNLWVEEPSGRFFAPTTWTVLDPAGQWLGSVGMPDGFTPYQIGDDFVLGRLEDELDVEYVVVYELLKP
ncbi:MAG: hypothetical protein R3195_09815 [Gemmatimonadota bacterium]|nr:hypothetical protein [Gemmatimonadota bacterium]